MRTVAKYLLRLLSPLELWFAGLRFFSVLSDIFASLCVVAMCLGVSLAAVLHPQDLHYKHSPVAAEISQ